jgi:Holliday junction resolvase RusA-like endonuclease
VSEAPVRLFVWGKPITQGSFIGVPNPKNPKRPFVRLHNNTVLQRWRKAIVAAGIEAMAGRDPLEGPLRVLSLVTIGERPHSRRHELYPATRGGPDIDKFLRGIFDALGGAGQGGPVIGDDGFIVDESTRKRWVGIAGGLAAPGVRITVEPMPVEALVEGT